MSIVELVFSRERNLAESKSHETYHLTFAQKIIVVLVFLLVFACGVAFGQSRIKDVAYVQGARDNDLVGYGLVVGLDGQGDSDPVLTKQTVANLMKRFGVQISQNDVKAKNCAVVMVTARISAFERNGAKIDVQVSSMADAKTLQGGTLLQTPLMGADSQIYAVAQGSVSVGGFFAGNSGAGGASVQKNHPTSGRIPGGALIEKEIPTDVFNQGVLEIALRENDFTSAVRMANAINEQLGSIAYAVDANTVRVYVPQEAQPENKQTEFIARIENIEFRPDAPARIVMNEKTGTIVANSKIRIHSVAVAHGNLTVAIATTQKVSQPNPFTGNVIGDLSAGSGGSGGAGGAAASGILGDSETPLEIGGRVVYQDDQGQQIQVPIGIAPPVGYTPVMKGATGQPGVASAGASGAPGGNVNVTTGAQTVVTEQTTTNVQEEKTKFIVVEDLPTVEDVAAALNALGVTPRDMMAIFQSMKQAGALQAELVLQ